MTATTFDQDLIKTARAVYKRRNDHKFGGARRWRELQEAWPGLAEAAKPGPDRGSGSGPDMAKGEYWRRKDGSRFARMTRPRARPTSDTSMPDGSPLRQLTPGVDAALWGETPDLEDLEGPLLDVDGSPFGSGDIGYVSLSRDDLERIIFDPVSAEDDGGEDPSAFAQITDAEDADVGAELPGSARGVWRLDGVHGERLVDRKESRDHKPHLPEYCAVCGMPLPLKRYEPVCEFPDSPMPEGQYCHCSGCLCPPDRNAGNQPKYCSGKCASRMDNALDRARRRHDRAARSRWSGDLHLDYLAEYRFDMRDRARRSRAGIDRISVPRFLPPFFVTFDPPIEPVPQPVPPKYRPPVRTAPITRASRLPATTVARFADGKDLDRARRMLVDNWPREDREMYVTGITAVGA